MYMAITLLGLFLANASGTGHLAESTPKVVALAVLDAYVRDSPAEYTQLVRKHGLPGIGFDQSAVALFESRQRSIETLGAIHGSIELSISGIPNRIERRLYLVEHDSFCVVWEFVFYRSPAVDEWLLVTLNTNQPIEGFIHLLPELPSP